MKELGLTQLFPSNTIRVNLYQKGTKSKRELLKAMKQRGCQKEEELKRKIDIKLRNDKVEMLLKERARVLEGK